MSGFSTVAFSGSRHNDSADGCYSVRTLEADEGVTLMNLTPSTSTARRRAKSSFRRACRVDDSR